MIQFKLRELGQFPTKEPELDRAIGELQGNVRAALEQIASKSAAQLVPTPRKTGTYQAKLGELVRVDSSGADAAVVLPKASASNAGQVVALVRSSSSNAVEVSALGSDVQGGVSHTLAISVGIHRFESDGGAWWKVVA